MFQVSCENIENFSTNSYFQVGEGHVGVRVLILVCVHKTDFVFRFIRFKRNVKYKRTDAPSLWHQQ